MNKFLTKGLEIVNNIKNKYINSDGLVSASYLPSRANLLAHLDDYAIFLLHFDEDQFIKNQIALSRKFTYQGLLVSNGRIVSYQNNEYLGAIHNYYKTEKDEDIKQVLKESLAGINNLLFHNGFIRTYYDMKNNSPPITSPMSGALLEVFLNNYEFSPDMSKICLQIMNNWIQIPFFQKYKLFPSKYYINNANLNEIFTKLNIPIPDKVKNRFGVNFFTMDSWANIIYKLPWGVKVQVSKDNTNFVFCLIQAYKITQAQMYKNAIACWIKSVKQKLYKDGFIHRFWNPQKGAKNIELEYNFPIIDILCDVYYYIEQNKSYLDFAEEIALSWIDNSCWSIGLFPKVYKGSFNHIDNQTDFCVSLVRIFELTGKRKYLDIAESILEGILKYHYTKDGYVTSINHDGEMVNRKIEPKYNALLLKALILFSEDKNIYGNNYMYNLMKDR